jgi:hypothetical protein
VAAVSSSARASDSQPQVFGVVDLSDPPANAAVRQRIEREASARGLVAVTDPAMRRALGTAEPTGASAAHLVLEARNARERDDFEAACRLSAEAEALILGELSIDEARPLLRPVLGVALTCADALGRPEAAAAAAARLRRIGASAPDGVPPRVWQRYGAPAAPATATGAAEIELEVDSDPPNARVAIDSHELGVTPLTTKVRAGSVVVEIEKAGYKKAFRRVSLGPGKTPRVSVPLVEHRRDRAAEIAARVLALRGSNPGGDRAALAQVSQLARVDVLVAFVARGATATVWWFDADRGDFGAEPLTLTLSPAGRGN